MTETTGKINKTKSWLVEKINNTLNCQPESSRKKGRRLKSIKLEVKMQKLQKATQKFKWS